jgi:hypothetical protein
MFSRSKSTSSPPASPTSVLTLAGVGDELHLSRPIISRLVKSRQIVSFRVGRRVFVTRRALEKFIASAERGA